MQNIGIELKAKIGMETNECNGRGGTTIKGMVGTTTIEWRRDASITMGGLYYY